MFVDRIDELTAAGIAELDAALAAAQRRRDEADAEMAAIVALVDAKQLFHEHAHSSLKAYLKQQLNCSGAEALRLKRRARLFNAHPEIADAFAQSRITLGQVDVLASAQQHPRAGERFGEFVGLFVEQAEHLEHDRFADALKHFVVQADQDGAYREQDFFVDQRTASVRVDNGAVKVHASGGDPLRAAEMKRVFDDAVEAEVHRDFESRRVEHGDNAANHPMARSDDQRRFDALYEIFMKSVAAPADAKRPEPLVNLVIDPASALEVLAKHGFIDMNDDDLGDLERTDPTDRRSATSTGVAVHPDVVLRAMIEGRIRRIVVDAHDVVIDMGRTQRLFSGKAREAAQLLAVQCNFRGCGVPAEFCDVDHVVPWVEGGETNQANAGPLCGKHDRVKHARQLRGRRDRWGNIHLIRPDGSIIKPLNAPDPKWAAVDSAEDQSDVDWSEWTTAFPRLATLPPPGTIRHVHLRRAS